MSEAQKCIILKDKIEIEYCIAKSYPSGDLPLCKPYENKTGPLRLLVYVG